MLLDLESFRANIAKFLEGGEPGEDSSGAGDDEKTAETKDADMVEE